MLDIIDDLASDKLAVTGSGWVLISDRVTGGISSGSGQHGASTPWFWVDLSSGMPSCN